MKNIFQDIPEHERESLISQNSEYKEKKDYRREFTKEELDELKNDLVHDSKAVNKMEIEIKDQIKALKQSLKSEKIAVYMLLDKVSNGYEEVEGDVYVIADHDKGVMCYYAPNGQFLSSRKMKSEERQLTISRTLPSSESGISAAM